MKSYLENFVNNSAVEFEHMIHNLNSDYLEQAADIIMESERKGGRVHVTGIGKPGHVAGYIASLLSSTGTSAYELDATEAVHGSSGQVKEGDVVIAISNSGETKELKATIETLKSNGARMISCTGNADSWLSEQSEVCLVAHADQEGDDLNKPPRASVLAEIFVLQSLSIVLQGRKGLDKKQYVKWHPGGSLGQSIREEQELERCRN